MAVETVFAADGILGFLVAWELMTLATAALVATDHESRPSRRSAFLYLAMSHLGTGCLVAAFFLLASGSGSLAFGDTLGAAAAASLGGGSSSSSSSWALASKPASSPCTSGSRRRTRPLPAACRP